jgi:type II secretory pathway pseudopilin PulG
MNMNYPKRTALRAGFTLVEIVYAMGISIIALAAMLSFFWGASTLATRNTFAANVITDVRLGAEYLAAEIADARSLELEEPAVDNPNAFSRVIYTRNVGLPGRIRNANRNDTVFYLGVDGQTWPSAGDHLLVAGISTSRPIVIASVEDPRVGVDDSGRGESAEVRIRLEESFQSLGVPATADLADGVTAFVTRRRAFAVVEINNQNVLGWFADADSTEPTRILARPLPETLTHPFSAASFDSASVDSTALGYNFEVEADRPNTVTLIGGRAVAFASSRLAGVVAPRSGETSLIGSLPAVTLAVLPPPPSTTPTSGGGGGSGGSGSGTSPIATGSTTTTETYTPRPPPPPVTVSIDF